MNLNVKLKMEESNLNNMENKYWEHIKNINWKGLCEIEGIDVNEKVSDYLRQHMTVMEISKMMNFVIDLRNKLIEKVNESKMEGVIRNKEKMYDTCSHIVGLGEETYYDVLSNLEKYVSFQEKAVSNFEFGFDIAIYELS